MTLPLVFTPTPHDAGTDNADAADAFGQVASTTAANFAKINAHLVARRPSFGWTKMTSHPVWSSDGVWHDFPAVNWPALIITVPATPGPIMVNIGAAVHSQGDPVGSSMWASFRVSGAGAFTHDPYWTAVGIETGMIALGCTAIIPAHELTPNVNVTITPQYVVTSTGVMYHGTLSAIALV